MTSGNLKSYLPVPEFIDNNLRHSQKQPHKLGDEYRNKKPPKLYPKHHDTSFNRSFNSSSAQLISFKESSGLNETINSPIYNRDNNETYFEQCFQTITKIGEGSFGEVFKVRSKEDGLLYAVKKSKQLFRSEHYRQERLEEVKRYEQFSGHEHCVTLYRAWEQDDRLYMQMELCKGSLESYLAKNKNLPESTIWSILLDLLLALKSLHDRNLIHLDIKLDNILISDDDSCKLADFGLVVDLDKAKVLSPTEGDNRYIAPELMQGYFSKAADVFSLGITILELACNLELPPNGPLWQQLRSDIMPEEFIKVLSPELQFVIKSMMSSDPMQRPTVDELLLNPKFVALLQNRTKWKMLKKIKQFIRRSIRYVWTKLCNLKNYTYNIFSPIIRRQRPTTYASSSSENSPNFLSDLSHLQNSPNFDEYETSGRIINSTPLNHHSVSFRRVKKDLSKTSFRCKTSPSDNYESSGIICKKLFKEDSD